MKKYLYGTTILAAVGLATGPVLAEETPIHLELGGGYSEYFGFGNQDVDAGIGNEIAFVSHEVHFKIVGEMANGLKIGGAIELEGESGGDQIDQAYVTLSGGFGVLRLGGINSGRYSMLLASPDVASGSNSGSQGQFMTQTSAGGTATTTLIDLSGDAQKITYFTPRFNGLQLAVSWAPTGNADTDGNDSGLIDEATEYENAWDLGASYKGDFGGVNISAMLGVGGADAPTNATTAGFDDFLLWNAGLTLGMAGFTVHASTTVIEDGAAANAAATESTKGSGWNVGISYKTGPWGFSVSRYEGDSKGLIARTDDTSANITSLGASYQLGPGLRTSLSLTAADTTGQSGAVLAQKNNDGYGMWMGIHVGF